MKLCFLLRLSLPVVRCPSSAIRHPPSAIRHRPHLLLSIAIIDIVDLFKLQI
jgi:hypothetical protein